MLCSVGRRGVRADATAGGNDKAPLQAHTRDIAMNRRNMLSLALLGGIAAVALTQPASSQSDGWTVLFDGKNLDNFTQLGDANWRVEDGAAVADKGNGFLVSRNTYRDFQLRAE